MAEPEDRAETIGWGGRVRTSEWRNQNPLPYHLATPHRSPGCEDPRPSGSSSYGAPDGRASVGAGRESGAQDLRPPAGVAIQPCTGAACARRCRSVAQPGSAPRSGRGGRRFESYHSDQISRCPAEDPPSREFRSAIVGRARRAARESCRPDGRLPKCRCRDGLGWPFVGAPETGRRRWRSRRRSTENGFKGFHRERRLAVRFDEALRHRPASSRSRRGSRDIASRIGLRACPTTGVGLSDAAMWGHPQRRGWSGDGRLRRRAACRSARIGKPLSWHSPRRDATQLRSSGRTVSE